MFYYIINHNTSKIVESACNEKYIKSRKKCLEKRYGKIYILVKAELIEDIGD